jgi:hypothetical protein
MNRRGRLSVFFIVFALVMLFAAQAWAGALLNYPKFKAFDSNGDPLAGGLLYTYNAGTTTEKTSYSDVDCTVAHANPIVLDSNGEATIYLTGAYKLILQGADGAVLWTMDNIQGTADEGGNYYYPSSSAADHGITGDSDTIKYYVDQIGTTNKATIFLRHDSGSEYTDYTLSTDETIPENIKLEIECGARIKIATGITLTQNGPFEAGLYQVFDCEGTGEVSFSNGSVSEVYPEWWQKNITPGTTDMSNAINSALSTGYEVILNKNNIYACNSTIDILTNNIKLKGNKAKIIFNSIVSKSININADNIKIKDLYIDGNTNSAIGIYLNESNYVNLEDINIYDHHNSSASAFGIYINASTYINIINGEIYNITSDIAANTNRGIYASSIAGSHHILVDNITIHDIIGYLDAEAIHFQTLNVAPYDSMYSVIKNCTIYNFHKRAIKMQASDVVIKNNFIYNDLGNVSDEITNDNPRLGISNFGSRNIIDGNIISLKMATYGIYIETGSVDTVVTNNKIYVETTFTASKCRDSAIRGIYIAECENICILNNTINATVGIGLTGVNTFSISNNYIYCWGIGIFIYSPTYIGDAAYNGLITNNRFETTLEWGKAIAVTGDANTIGIYNNNFIDVGYAISGSNTCIIDTDLMDQTYGNVNYEYLEINQDLADRLNQRINGITEEIIWDPGNIVDGDRLISPDITVLCANVGDVVLIYPGTSQNGLLVYGYVASPETIKIVLQNNTGGSIDLPSSTWKVSITKIK